MSRPTRAQIGDRELPAAATSAVLTSALSPQPIDANCSDVSSSWAWNLGPGTTFFPQHWLQSSSALHKEALMQQTPPLESRADTAIEIERVGNGSQMRGRSYVSSSSRETPGSTSDSFPSVRDMAMSPHLGEESFATFPDATEFWSPSLNMATSSDWVPSGDMTTSPHSREDPFTTFPDSTKHQNASLDMARSAEASKAVSAKSTSLAGSDNLLPSTPHILELLDVFFTRYHSFLPCIHQRTFVERVKRDRGSARSSPLLWALLAVAAPAHHEPHLQALQSSWLARARSIFDKGINTMAFPTQSLQAAVWIIFQAYVSADLAEAWFFLGKTCRLASLFGWDRIDCLRTARITPLAPQPRDAIETEERRKTIWVLFFLDRSLSCLAGFPLAIDDRQFNVNFPVDDDLFQASNFSNNHSQITPDPFTTDLSTLVNMSVMQSLTSKASMSQIFRASVLLGRIMTLHNHLHLSRDRKEYLTELSNLENILSLFCFALSRGSNAIWDVPASQLNRYLWLNILVQTCNILLYHPTATDPSPSISTPPEGAESSLGFSRCLSAMRNALRIAKTTASRSADALVNPFLVPAYFLCCRFLSINWHEHKNQSDRDDPDFILMLVDRVGEKWAPLAKKFRTSIIRDLGKDVQEASRMRVGTGNYLDVGCA